MIPKKTRELFASLMEAGSDGSAVTYDNETEQYTGYFNPVVVDRFIKQGAFELVSDVGPEITILINSRGDFLSGFASGVNEARLGHDNYYADYNANPFSFSVGFEHFIYLSKKPKQLVGYKCHGFTDDDTGLIYQQ